MVSEPKYEGVVEQERHRDIDHGIRASNSIQIRSGDRGWPRQAGRCYLPIHAQRRKTQARNTRASSSGNINSLSRIQKEKKCVWSSLQSEENCTINPSR
jgi:hypothetical protein